MAVFSASRGCVHAGCAYGGARTAFVDCCAGGGCSLPFGWRMLWRVWWKALCWRCIPGKGILPSRPMYAEYELLSAAIETRIASEAARATTLVEARRQLEVLLDSMRDLVLAVDDNGRILWANEPMRRHSSPQLAPAASPAGGAIRLGHHLVQSIREPEVLSCMRIALEERVASSREAVRFSTGAHLFGKRGAHARRRGTGAARCDAHGTGRADAGVSSSPMCRMNCAHR